MDLMSKCEPEGLAATTLVALSRQKAHWSHFVGFSVESGPFLPHVLSRS